MWNVVVTRGTFATRGEAARFAGQEAARDPGRIIVVRVEPSIQSSHLSEQQRRRIRRPELL